MARVTAWADRNLLPGVLTVALLTDVAVGLVWVWTDPWAFRAGPYDIARELWPMRMHGAALLAVTTVTVTLYAVRGRCWLSGYLTWGWLGGLWAFWSVLFVLGPLARPGGVSLTLAAFGLALFGIHMLGGLAASHPPRQV